MILSLRKAHKNFIVRGVKMILIISIQTFMKQPDKDKIAILRMVAKGEMKIIDLEVQTCNVN